MYIVQKYICTLCATNIDVHCVQLNIDVHCVQLNKDVHCANEI